MVFMALCGDLEITGGHRRIDGSPGRDDHWDCIDDRGSRGQPNACGCHYWHSTCDCGPAVVCQRDFLNRFPSPFRGEGSGWLGKIRFRLRLSSSKRHQGAIPERSESSPHLWNTRDQKKDNDQGIDQWADDIPAQLEEVTFFAPGIMQGCERCNQIN